MKTENEEKVKIPYFDGVGRDCALIFRRRGAVKRERGGAQCKLAALGGGGATCKCLGKWGGGGCN